MESDLEVFADAMTALERAHEKLTVQGLIVETIGSDAELERANKLAEKVEAVVTFGRKEAADE